MPPQNQTVLPGTTVSLYCLFKTESSLDDRNNTWLFGDTTLDSNVTVYSNLYDVIDGGQVLVIRNVTMETSGVYTCCMASGEQYTAHVDVLGELTIINDKCSKSISKFHNKCFFWFG